jgi:hypothetical protein
MNAPHSEFPAAAAAVPGSRYFRVFARMYFATAWIWAEVSWPLNTEPPRARVVLQHPKRRLVEAEATERIVGRETEFASGAGVPMRWIDVDRVELTDSLAVPVTTGADAGEPCDLAVHLGDEHARRAGEDRPPVVDAPLERDRLELLRGKDVRVRLLPRPQVHAGDPLGVGRCRRSDHRANLHFFR